MSLRNLLFFGAVAVLTTAGCTSSDGGAAHESATQTPTTETSTADAAAATADKQKTATESEEAGTTKTHNGKSHRHSRTPASNGKASAKNVYVVQIGAFKIKENAEKLHDKLVADGFPVVMEPLQHSKNGLLYVVRMNPVSVRGEAETLRETLKTKADVESVVLALPSVATATAAETTGHEPAPASVH